MFEQVDVLLATYQGAEFLEEQLDSLFSQTYPHFHVWARDDGSQDQTPTLLNKWQSKFPQKMTVIPSKHNLGVKGNFSELLANSQAPYILFADQDDKWLPHKIQDSLKAIKILEEQHSTLCPLLIHSDLIVANQQLKQIAPSFWGYAGLNPKKSSLNRLLAQNVITGCTMLINRSLLELAKPIPDESIMHDWWIALVASSFGHIGYLDKPTMLYRQHTTNDTGAKPYQLLNFLKNRSQKNISLKTYTQASHFLNRYETLLSPKQKELLKAYAEMGSHSYFNQKRQMLKHRFFKQGFLRNIKELVS